MPDFISPEQHRAEVSALNREIFRLSKELETHSGDGAPDPQDPFRNPTEYHASRSDYSKIVPELREMNAPLPLEPAGEEKKRLKHAYSIGGGIMLAHFIVSDYLASAIMIVIMLVIRSINPDADSEVIADYVTASSIIAGLMLIVYLLANVGFAVLGMKLNKDDCRDWMRTRDFNFAKAVQYCLIGIFVLLISTVSSYYVENIFNQFGHTTNVMETDDMAVTTIGKVVMILYTCIIAPITEEIFFRGFLLKTFGKANQRFAVFFTALMFGLAHKNIPQFILTFLLGIFLAHITLKHGSLIPAILVHFFLNTFSTVMSDGNFKDSTLIIVTEIFLAMAVMGGVMLIIFRLGDKIPATTPAQSRRGFSMALSTPIVLLTVILLTLYLFSLIFSSPLLNLIRTYL